MGRPFYGFLSNRYTSALVSPLGVLEWLPFPRFDSDAIFCRLLDEEQGGFLSTLPSQALVAHEQSYRPGTLILETLLTSEDGSARICDFLAVGHDGFWRRIETTMPLDLICHPTFGFGSANAAYHILNNGALYSHPGGTEGISLYIRGPVKKLARRDTWVIGPGHVDVVVRYAESLRDETALLLRPLQDGELVERTTERYWINTRKTVPVSDWSSWLEQSLLVLRGLTYRTNGAMIAAATTSLPEVVGEKRQWDYRFVWMRDGAYAAEALLMVGDWQACRQYLEFVLNIADLVEKPFRRPFVRVDGTVGGGERDLGWLSGYHGSRPVRVGNQASLQLQLDLEGDVLWVVWRYWRMTGDRQFIQEYWWAIESIVHWVAEHGRWKDASLWEFRGKDEHYTHSQVLSWVAVKVGSELAREVMGDEKLAAAWQKTHQQQRRLLWDTFHERPENRFGQSFENMRIDAALLTLPLYGFISVEDEVFRNTLIAVEHDLVSDNAVWRYQSDVLGVAQYPFPLAGFWLARVYLRLGQLEKADQIIAQQLVMSTDLKLFAEHVNPTTGEPHGNFPQLFTHAACVTTLMERERYLGGEKRFPAF